MTIEDNKSVGVESSANGEVGGEQVENGKSEVNIQELIKTVESLKEELKSRDKALNDKSQMLKDYEAKQEADRLARLSESEQLKELQEQIKADKDERELINAATANGLNPAQARQLVEKVKSGDYSSFAVEMATLLNEVKSTTSQEVEEKVKSSIQTSSAPAIKEETEDSALTAFKRGMGRA